MNIQDIVQIVYDPQIGSLSLASKQEFFPGDLMFEEQPLMVLTFTLMQTTEFILGRYESYLKLNQITRSKVMQLFCPSIDELKEDRDYDIIRQMSASALNPEECVKFHYICKFNLTEYNDEGTLTALYEYHARICHSCAPNAVFYKRKISVGEQITISYLKERVLIASKHVRQAKLRSIYWFDCHCERCSEPMDYSRVMRCSNCKKSTVVWGAMLNSLSEDRNIAAKCISCKQCYTSDELPLRAEQELEREVVELEMFASSLKTEELMPKVGPRVLPLLRRVQDTLGGCHWTTATLMKLHAESIAIREAPLNFIYWILAFARWLKLTLPTVKYRAASTQFNIGNTCISLPQPFYHALGRYYLKCCYDDYRGYCGADDEQVKRMDKLFKEWDQRNIKLDVLPCSYIKFESRGSYIMCPTSGKQSPSKICSGCNLAHYCSKECQKADWKIHKLVCIPCQGLTELHNALRNQENT